LGGSLTGATEAGNYGIQTTVDSAPLCTFHRHDQKLNSTVHCFR